MLRWTLRAYEPQRDFPCEEYPLVGATAEDLRPLLGAPADDPLYDVVPVGPEALPALVRRFSLVLPPTKRDYFVDCGYEAGDAVVA